jgi:gamma-glutamyltranspeptidase / glutathione hydrolase
MRASICFKSVLFIFFIFTSFLYSESPDPVRAKNGMVVSASRLATEVGVNILKQGGNAVDASVAVGFALAVTHPSAGNLGGGGFMVIHLNGKDITLDYREKAPAKSTWKMFLDSAGNYLPEISQEGALSAGVPGSVAGLIYALEKFGTMQLKEVIQPAIDLAETGFYLEYKTAESFKAALPEFLKYPSSTKIFTKDGQPFEEGDLFIQKDLAFTLSRIRDYGRDGFYDGTVAYLLEKQITELNGILNKDDLKNYQAVERPPATGNYRGHKIVSMGPPSAGGIALIQMLNILENFNFEKSEWGSSIYYSKLIEAMKYAYADRSAHLGDEGFYKVPKEWLISKEYARQIFDKISFNLNNSDTVVSSSSIIPGKPEVVYESDETTHYNVYDSYGNAVSTTTTINSSYGSKIVVEGAGFLLNNEMDDFAAKPGAQNQFGLTGSIANSVQPGKRMLSSMTPVIVFKNDKPYLMTGSPGGSTIITVVLQVLLNCIDFNMNIQQAINQPRIHHQWLPDLVLYEKFGMSTDVKQNLINKGYILGDEVLLGRAEGILINSNNNIIYGATDPRGFGSAAGF